MNDKHLHISLTDFSSGMHDLQAGLPDRRSSDRGLSQPFFMSQPFFKAAFFKADRYQPESIRDVCRMSPWVDAVGCKEKAGLVGVTTLQVRAAVKSGLSYFNFGRVEEKMSTHPASC